MSVESNVTEASIAEVCNYFTMKIVFSEYLERDL